MVKLNVSKVCVEEKHGDREAETHQPHDLAAILHQGARQRYGDGHGVDLPAPGVLGQVPQISAREPRTAYSHHDMAQRLPAPGGALVRAFPSPEPRHVPGHPDGGVLPGGHSHRGHPAVMAVSYTHLTLPT